MTYPQSAYAVDMATVRGETVFSFFQSRRKKARDAHAALSAKMICVTFGIASAGNRRYRSTKGLAANDPIVARKLLPPPAFQV